MITLFPRQDDNDTLRREFAEAANQFHKWLTDTRLAYYV